MRWLVTSFGSSPRMRGARTARSSGPSSWRIIPAYAGSTVVPVAVPREAEDHPRVCGEHQHRGSPSLLVRGSSPRMRGAPQRRNDFTARIGIIPAYAGSTPREQKSSGPTTDHPRVCGEHCGRNGQILPLWGSSPRMRGALADAVSEIQYIGIIPAYAGSTQHRNSCQSAHRDHPRVCGEHTAPQFLPIRSSGSSPRMRGALFVGESGRLHPGIIPAYAGSTSVPLMYVCPTQDHPRVCGEHQVVMRATLPLRGSSPRMRGAPRDGANPEADLRIIPAYAGSTGDFAWGTDENEDHPRVCGEHRSSIDACAMMAGSSPRMRGALCEDSRCKRDGRIIPAYAGSTCIFVTSCEPRGGSSPRMRGAPCARL